MARSVKFEPLRSEAEDAQSDVASYKIASYPADFTLEVLHKKEADGFVYVPEFQRHFVWNLKQASKLIESFLLGLPVPQLFMYKDEPTGKLVVIDGQQRLKSIFGFFDGTITIRGSEREFRLVGVHDRWKAKLFVDLETRDQQKFRDSVLRAVIVEQLDPKDRTSVFHIYERLNTGGTVLTPQEVRNCVYRGTFNALLKELNETTQWRLLFGSQRSDYRMRDIELILRFFALHDCLRDYEKPMKEFLSVYMDNRRNPDKRTINAKRRLFIQTVQNVCAALGKKPFHRKSGLNAAVFDSVMVAFARNSNASRRGVAAKYARLLTHEPYLLRVTESTTDESAVHKRIDLANHMLFGA